MRVSGKKVKVTALDVQALRLVKACGFVGIDRRGEPCLESNSQISAGRLQRLTHHGMLQSGGDYLPLGDVAQPQCYVLTERGRLAADA